MATEPDPDPDILNKMGPYEPEQGQDAPLARGALLPGLRDDAEPPDPETTGVADAIDEDDQDFEP